jgi:NADP-dependent 3-hydroxy acid dehydrogenase YdfG
VVKTEIGEAAGIPKEMVELGYKVQPFMESIDVANAVLYALATPPHVQVK